MSAASTYAQKWDEIIVPISQPSAYVSLKLSYRHHATVGGQLFTCYIKNLKQERITVSFDMIASTVCGTEVSKHIDMELKASEGDGNGSIMNDDYVGLVQSSDCKGVKFRYYSQNVNAEVEGTNRIKGMGFRNFIIKSYPVKTASSSTNNSSLNANNSSAYNSNSSFSAQNNNQQS